MIEKYPNEIFAARWQAGPDGLPPQKAIAFHRGKRYNQASGMPLVPRRSAGQNPENGG